MTLFVEGGGGLVEDQDLGVLDEGSCDGDALLLPARQVRSLESTKLFEARMEILFNLFDLFFINHLLKPLFIHLFDTMSAVHADIALEIFPCMRMVRQVVHLVVLFGLPLPQIGARRATIELAFVHLEGEADLATPLRRQLRPVLVQKGDDSLRLLVEQVPVEQVLPGDVRLVRLLGQHFEQLLEGLLQLAQARLAKVRDEVVKHEKLFVAEFRTIDHLRDRGKVGEFKGLIGERFGYG